MTKEILNEDDDFENGWNNESFIPKKKKVRKIRKGIPKEKKLSKTEVDIGIIKKLYDAIIIREIINVAAIRYLEKITSYNFKNMKDLKNKIGNFLENNTKKTEMSEEELEDWIEVFKNKINGKKK